MVALGGIASFVVFVSFQRTIRSLLRPESFVLSVEKIPKKENRTFIARGFGWNPGHIERLKLLSLANVSLPSRVKDELAGNWMIHGVGAGDFENLYLPNDLLTQHLFVMGAPGTGKTRFLELLIDQAIARGESVIVIDPKGDERLLDRVWDSAFRYHRQADFRLFAPPYPSQSVRYNPVRCYAQPTDVGDRIAVLLPSGGDSEPFRKHAQNFANNVACALHTLREEITLSKLESYIFHHPWQLVRRLARHYGFELSNSNDPNALLREYEHFRGMAKEKLPDLDALVGMASIGRDHFAKISSALRPILGKLAARNLGYLLCPGDIDVPPDHRAASGVEPLTWEDVDRKRQIVFFFLGSLMGQDTANAVARMSSADLASYYGRKYAFQIATEYARTTIAIDEIGDVFDAPCVNLLNKSRGAGVSIVGSGQSIADLEVALGSHANARRALANIASFVTLRAANPEDARFFSDKCGLRPQKQVTEGESYEPALFSSGRRNIDDFAYHMSRSTSLRSDVLVPTWAVDELPRAHFFATWAGQVYKGHIPLLKKPETLLSPTLKRSNLLTQRPEEPPFSPPKRRWKGTEVAA
jgi:conjugal transfer pilus assembly protein TraD